MVRFIADIALFVLLGGSVLLRRPFSIDYARLDPQEAAWPPALFRKVNYLVSGAWAIAFLAMAVADGTVAFIPQLALYGSIAVSVVALGLAATFTLRYPAHAAKKSAQA
jgi:hypothetical protein